MNKVFFGNPAVPFSFREGPVALCPPVTRGLPLSETRTFGFPYTISNEVDKKSSKKETGHRHKKVFMTFYFMI